jgi:formylglycine-generating enzyme required for sulfatase activity
LRDENQKQLAAGRIPDSFTVYRRHHDQATYYASVWVAAPAQSGVLEADMYVEVHQDKHQELGWGPLGERGVGVPRVNAVMEQSDGFQYHTSIRWRTRQDVGYFDSWDVAWERVEARRKNNREPIELQARVSPQLTDLGSAGADAIWWQNLPVDSACLEYQPRREHLRRTQERFDQGFYPVSLHVASLGTDPTPLFGSTWWRSKNEIAQSVVLGNQMRNLAFTLFHLGVPELVVDALGDREQHELRGSLISGCHEFDIQPAWLADRVLDEAAHETLRLSCAMALSLYPAQSIAAPVFQRVAAALPQLYGQTQSPGLRSVSETIADRWGLKLEPATSMDSARELSTIAGDRLIVLQPKNPVWVGAARGEPGRDSFLDPEVPVNLQGPFAIATREVTIDQYRKFVLKFSWPVEYARTADCPVMNISWFEAAKYCRWLSEQEGIPEDQMCYPKIDEIGPGMTLENDYLQRIGYRMPTEAEWEFACQGGVQQRRWFGFDSNRLNQHAWTTANSNYVLHPVGRLLPNDFGLFDTLGNAMELTGSVFRPFPADLSAPELDHGSAGATIQTDTLMVNRGGAFIYQPLDARTSQRNRHMAETQRIYLSFRIARTVQVQAE